MLLYELFWIVLWVVYLIFYIGIWKYISFSDDDPSGVFATIPLVILTIIMLVVVTRMVPWDMKII